MFVYIRDRIVINVGFQTILESFPDPLMLIAREIVHEAGHGLSLPPRRITVVAESYDGHGGSIAVNGGHASGQGSRGYTGRSDNDIHDGGPGGEGGAGPAGGPGGSALVSLPKLTVCKSSCDGRVGRTGRNRRASGFGRSWTSYRGCGSGGGKRRRGWKRGLAAKEDLAGASK